MEKSYLKYVYIGFSTILAAAKLNIQAAKNNNQNNVFLRLGIQLWLLSTTGHPRLLEICANLKGLGEETRMALVAFSV